MNFAIWEFWGMHQFLCKMVRWYNELIFPQRSFHGIEHRDIQKTKEKRHTILDYLFERFISSKWMVIRYQIQIEKIRIYFPTPGVEPGPAGWKPAILAVRPRGIVVHSTLFTSDLIPIYTGFLNVNCVLFIFSILRQLVRGTKRIKPKLASSVSDTFKILSCMLWY